MNFENEIWKPICVTGYEENYFVSNYGRIKSLNYHLVKGREEILKPAITPKGYNTVEIGGKAYMVHRLVWISFNGEIPDGLQVNHINEDKTDNRLENLNLMTPKENNNWGTHIQRVAAKSGPAQRNNKFSKPILQIDLNGKIIKEWPSIHEIQREMNIHHNHISRCCRGLSKTCIGYRWRYKDDTE